MLTLLRLFIDIALWRKGPQDLPASTTLLVVVAVSYMLASFIQGLVGGVVASAALTLSLIDISTVSALIVLVLIVMSRRARLLQTLTAVLGVGVLLGSIDIIIRGVILFTTGSHVNPVVWGWAQLMLVLLIMGRVLMNALETGLFTGMALTFAIVLASDAVANALVSMPQLPSGS